MSESPASSPSPLVLASSSRSRRARSPTTTLTVSDLPRTDSCQAAHMGYYVSGRIKVVMDDGEETEYGPGDFAIIPPGHDAWVVGDEPCVVIDWQGFADYAKR